MSFFQPHHKWYGKTLGIIFHKAMLLIIFQIERDISYLTQDQMTVAVYYTKLKGSYNNTICSCGADHRRHRLMQFLMGLNDTYSAIQGKIMLMNPLPDAAKAYASVMQEEKQRSLRSIHEILDNSAMAVRKAESVALAARRGQCAHSRSLSANPCIALTMIVVIICEKPVGN
jgi:hypothetical protein